MYLIKWHSELKILWCVKCCFWLIAHIFSSVGQLETLNTARAADLEQNHITVMSKLFSFTYLMFGKVSVYHTFQTH